MNPRALAGMLVVNKQRGMISKDVSRWLERRLGKLHIGHVGTLDPMAEGILPILLGSATRLQDFLLELPKTYEFDMTFGYETDTLDAEGQVVGEAFWDHVTIQKLFDSLEKFRGEIEQIPPIFSAVKFKGKALYKYARADAASEVPTESLVRRVTIEKLELKKFVGGVATLEVTSSKGTYVRTLVKDIAGFLGTKATMTRLVRTAAAGVKIEQSHTLEGIEQSLDAIDGLVVPVEEFGITIPRWQAVELDAVSRLKAGQIINVSLSDFVKTADAKTHDFSSFEKDIQWLLLDSLGKAFGLGSVRFTDSGRTLINMKRGVQ